jgi:hypothetical protein
VVDINTIRDNIVFPNTLKGYISELIKLSKYVIENEPEWLTDYGRETIIDLLVQRENEQRLDHRKRLVKGFAKLLREAHNLPFLNVHLIAADRYVNFLLTFEGRTSRFMSTSAYINKRASLNHMWRAHNRIGYPPDFNKEIGNLMKGLLRQIAEDGNNHRRRRNRNNNNNNEHVLAGFDAEGDDDEGDGTTKVGKEPMSVQLYKQLCRWLLDYGTKDGVFGFCYLVVTWNLSCRSGNTARIHFRDISWT